MLRSINNNNNCCRRRGEEDSSCGRGKGARNGAQAAICSGEDQPLQGCLVCKVTVVKGFAWCKPDCPKGAKNINLPLPQRTPKKSTSLCPHQHASPALWGSWRPLIKKESRANPRLSRNSPSPTKWGRRRVTVQVSNWAQLAPAAWRRGWQRDAF